MALRQVLSPLGVDLPRHLRPWQVCEALRHYQLEVNGQTIEHSTDKNVDAAEPVQ